mgnify:FL=1
MEPARHSFAYGTGSSRFDFSDFRTSLESLHEKQDAQRKMLEGRFSLSDDQFREVQNHFQFTRNFQGQVAEFVQDYDTDQARMRDFMQSMTLTSQQVDALYEYHRSLGEIPGFPSFPIGQPRRRPPFPRPPPPPPPY